MREMDIMANKDNDLKCIYIYILVLACPFSGYYVFNLSAVCLWVRIWLYILINSDDSSDDEDNPRKGKRKEEKEADIGKVVCVELGDKKKQKDNWFPGLVVAPTAQDTVRIRVRDEYLVRSFKDGR